jgi:hypothetical protein
MMNQNFGIAAGDSEEYRVYLTNRWIEFRNSSNLSKSQSANMAKLAGILQRKVFKDIENEKQHQHFLKEI